MQIELQMAARRTETQKLSRSLFIYLMLKIMGTIVVLLVTIFDPWVWETILSVYFIMKQQAVLKVELLNPAKDGCLLKSWYDWLNWTNYLIFRTNKLISHN